MILFDDIIHLAIPSTCSIAAGQKGDVYLFVVVVVVDETLTDAGRRVDNQIVEKGTRRHENFLGQPQII